MHLSAVWPFTPFGDGAAVSDDRSGWCLISPYPWPFPSVVRVALVRIPFRLPHGFSDGWQTFFLSVHCLSLLAVLGLGLFWRSLFALCSPRIGCVLPCSWRRQSTRLSVPMRPPCLRLHAHCLALCGCHRQSLYGPVCPFSRALGWPLRFMRHNRMLPRAYLSHGLLLRVHPTPLGTWTNEGLGALSTGPEVCVSLTPSAGPAPLYAYDAHPWVHNLRRVTCNTLDIHEQHLVCMTSRFTVRIALALSWPIRFLRTKSPMPAPSAANDSAVGNGSAAIETGSVSAPKASASTDPSSSSVLISQTPPAPVPAYDDDHDLYDLMVHTDTSNMLEDSLDVPSDCALLVDIDGITQTVGDDLVHGALDEAVGSLIREVTASILGNTPRSFGTDATTAPAITAAMLTTSPVASVLSRSTSACAR
ncbi:hypothetical protein V6N12_028952 [Hibiscus sabdariffa]|uniref:Uncharacterized protein n=1 Tax=Hibiscus sabdariffa TaxID=183260 RepID=A0ABR2F7C1_9ROSI